MPQHPVLAAAAAVAAAVVLLTAPTASAAPRATAAAAAATPVTSTIFSAATNSCVDVPGGTTDPNTALYGQPCTGTAEQQFTFQPVSGRTNTYRIVNQASKICMVQYRFGVRQRNCLTAVPYDPVLDMWTLIPVNTTTHTYRFQTTSSTGPSARCIAVHPTPNGYPGPTLTLDYCTAGVPAQTLKLTTAP